MPKYQIVFLAMNVLNILSNNKMHFLLFFIEQRCLLPNWDDKGVWIWIFLIGHPTYPIWKRNHQMKNPDSDLPKRSRNTFLDSPN